MYLTSQRVIFCFKLNWKFKFYKHFMRRYILRDSKIIICAVDCGGRVSGGYIIFSYTSQIKTKTMIK